MGGAGPAARPLEAWEESSVAADSAMAESAAGVKAEAEDSAEADSAWAQREVEDWVVVPLEREEEDSATADLEAEVWVVAERAAVAETAAVGSAGALTAAVADSGAVPREFQAGSLEAAETEAVGLEGEEAAKAAGWRGWEEEDLGAEEEAAGWMAVGVGRVEEEAQALCPVRKVAEEGSVEASGVGWGQHPEQMVELEVTEAEVTAEHVGSGRDRLAAGCAASRPRSPQSRG